MTMKLILASVLAILLAVSATAPAWADGSNIGGGPGNSGPGDKNGQNEKGHGGQP
jgi:hypothetical protein